MAHPDRPQDEVPVRLLANVERRRFVGAHANVGCGHGSDVLAQTPLRWSMEKAAAHGLRFRSAVDADDGATTAAIADS